MSTASATKTARSRVEGFLPVRVEAKVDHRKRHADAFYGPGPRYETAPDSPEELAWWSSVAIHEADPERCPVCVEAANR